MKVLQSVWQETKGWNPPLESISSSESQLVFVFGKKELLKLPFCYPELKTAFPVANIMGCSTSGEIHGSRVLDNTIVISAVKFEKTTVKGVSLQINSAEESYEVGQKLIQSLDLNGLAHLFVLSDGINVNGSDLVKGITDQLPQGITLTGGLSGDGDKFQDTVVIWNAPAKSHTIALLGFYGSNLQVSYASMGGWDPFGPERVVTKSKGNVLYELDGKSALELYKLYLGDYAKNLPSSGLLFPLIVQNASQERGVVRTILSVNESDQSLIFAGDITEGSKSRLMKANMNRLVDGAVEAARICFESLQSNPPGFSILISCVGRKMIMKQQVEEEVEGVLDIFGQDTPITGFYSYGEISPFDSDEKCELHNQTMTITAFQEF